jgi:hypothetical protein
MSDQSTAPSPAEEWEPPTSDQEFVFEGMDSVPAWVPKDWAGFNQGPALQVPAGDIMGFTGPYHTKVARLGDTVVFTAAKGATPAKLTVIPGEPIGDQATKKPAQQSNCSVEDALKTGMMTPDDLGDDAKAQVAARSPGMKKLVEEGKGAPEPQSIADFVKTD